MPKDQPDIFTAAGFLAERHDFLHVYAVESVSGEGYDVVLRIDGTYSDEELAEEAAVGMREWIMKLKDIPTADHLWWLGPPF